jgi:hypothetical protein
MLRLLSRHPWDFFPLPEYRNERFRLADIHQRGVEVNSIVDEEEGTLGPCHPYYRSDVTVWPVGSRCKYEVMLVGCGEVWNRDCCTRLHRRHLGRALSPSS